MLPPPKPRNAAAAHAHAASPSASASSGGLCSWLVHGRIRTAYLLPLLVGVTLVAYLPQLLAPGGWLSGERAVDHGHPNAQLAAAGSESPSAASTPTLLATASPDTICP